MIIFVFRYRKKMEQELINKFVVDSIDELKLIDRRHKKFSELMSKHNPYELSVFCKTSQEIVDFVMVSHKQTSRQTIMGNLLESIAIKINSKKFNGYKSNEECTDLEWEDNGLFHYRGWKSSPKWGNADQKNRVNKKLDELKENENFGSFRVLTSYGKTTKKNGTKTFSQLSGQDSWDEISNDKDMYNKVMIGILQHSNYLREVIENIYLSDVKESVTWVEKNFTNKDKTINFIKINEYVSGRDKVTID